MKSTAKRVGLALALLVAAGAESGIAGEKMSAYSIRSAFRGITLDGVYEDGTFFSETYREDGTIRYHDVDRSDSGQWSIRGNTFCTFYDSQDGGCFFVERDGTNCFTFFDAIDQEGRQVPNATWTSRGWNRDQPSTCKEAPEAAI